MVFSIVDVVAVLTDSPNPRKYWSVLKTRLKAEGSKLATNCSQLKMQTTDGKFYIIHACSVQISNNGWRIYISVYQTQNHGFPVFKIMAQKYGLINKIAVFLCHYEIG
jgi:hypothetical protein